MRRAHDPAGGYVREADGADAHGLALPSPAPEWLVLRCSSSRTMALASALANRGAWTPTWKRKRRMPRSNVSRLVSEPCIPSFVFIPASEAFDLPQVPLTPFSFMRFEGTLIRIADRELEPLRRVAERPKVPARKLPKPGSLVRFVEGPFEGLRAKVLSCSSRYAKVAIDGFAQPVQVPPCLLQKIGA